MRAFGEWEVIAACLFFMLLLPLIFFIASADHVPVDRRRFPDVQQQRRPAERAALRKGSGAAGTGDAEGARVKMRAMKTKPEKGVDGPRRMTPQ